MYTGEAHMIIIKDKKYLKSYKKYILDKHYGEG